MAFFTDVSRQLVLSMAGSFLKEIKRDSKGDMPGVFLVSPPIQQRKRHVRGRGYFAPEPASRTRPRRI